VCFFPFGYVFQLTEDWGEALFSALRRAGGTAFSNMAVGYNNVDINAANKYGVAVGNTPVSSFVVCLLTIILCMCALCHVYVFYRYAILLDAACMLDISPLAVHFDV
jgi:lactate dehydrogenase-like 2-hydroxyacid dehydrogenase